MIRKYISNFAEDVPEEYYVTENQLDMFEDFSEEDFNEEIDAEVEEENNEHALPDIRQGPGSMEEEERIRNNEYRISNIESQDPDPDKPPTLF